MILLVLFAGCASIFILIALARSLSQDDPRKIPRFRGYRWVEGNYVRDMRTDEEVEADTKRI
jgi:hypothetical protein